MIPNINSLSATSDTKVKPKELAAKVQAMFMETMMKAMEESVDAEDGLYGKSAGADMYRGMLREQMALAVSSRMESPLAHDLDRAMNGSSATAAAKAKVDLPSSDLEVRSRQHSHEDSHKLESELPVDGRISSKKGWRRDPITGQSRYHAGTDIAAPEGTPVKAVAQGRVIESGPKGGYGNTVVIQTEDGRKMLYAHNNQNLVRVGDWVSRGDAIAEVGSTGRATGPHVHFEVKF